MNKSDNPTLDIDLNVDDPLSLTEVQPAELVEPTTDDEVIPTRAIPIDWDDGSSKPSPQALSKIAIKSHEVAEDLFSSDIVTQSLLNIACSMSTDVDSLGLNKVKERTITYVDNENKDVLLINKHLLSIGEPLIPVIVPGLAVKFLQEADKPSKQGNIVLYEGDDGGAKLGILMSFYEGEDSDTAKVITTDSGMVVASFVPHERIKNYLN